MLTTHVSFNATDLVTLPGLLYEPATTTKAVTIWLHGMGDSGVFYHPNRLTTLAKSLTDRDIALLAFNNRGAHNNKVLRKDDPSLSRREQYYQAGTHYELIKDCVNDIDGALAYLKAQGYTNFYLAGHSTGANKIVVYDAKTKTSAFKKYVLAGPGDDVGLRYQELGSKRFWQTLDYARAAVASGKPLKVMPKYSGMHPFSAQSTADMMDPDGDYNIFAYYEALNGPLSRKPAFKEYRGITIPLLVVAGSEDDSTDSAGGAAAALVVLQDNTNPQIISQSAFQLIDGSDHSFTGYEHEFAEAVASWLVK